MTKSNLTYQVYMNGNAANRFNEEVLAFNFIRNKAMEDKTMEFTVDKIEHIFDSEGTLKDKARLNKYRNSTTGNAIHASLRKSEWNIGNFSGEN
jgi:hypothetical protein